MVKNKIRREESNLQPCRAFPLFSLRKYWQRFDAPACAVGLLILASLLVTAPAVAQDRPKLLPALYAGQIGLQAYDAYSTIRVIQLGGVEKNPHVDQLLTRRPGAFFAMKAGVAAMTIVAPESLWKRGRKTEAILVMIGSNGFMAYVAVHNGRVLNQLEKGRN